MSDKSVILKICKMFISKCNRGGEVISHDPGSRSTKPEGLAELDLMIMLKNVS